MTDGGERVDHRPKIAPGREGDEARECHADEARPEARDRPQPELRQKQRKEAVAVVDDRLDPWEPKLLQGLQ